MEIICGLLDEGQRTMDNRSISETIKTLTNHFIELSNVSATPPSRSTQNITLLTSHLDPWDFHDWNKNVVVPFLCTIGIIGIESRCPVTPNQDPRSQKKTKNNIN